MSFEDSTQAGTAARSLGVSSGEFRAVQRDTPTVVPGAEPATAPQPNLHYVFDDPNDGEVGRDRMLVHVLWEAALLVAVVVVGFLLVGAEPGSLSGDSLRIMVLIATLIGLLGLASAIALRAGVPNLAVGGAAIFAGVFVAEHSGGAWGGAAAQALGICAVIGLVQGLVIVSLHVPAWAASLGTALALGGWATLQRPPRQPGGYDAVADAYLWFGGVAAFSVVLSLVGLHPGLRRGFGRFRPVADPARRRGMAAAVIAVAATTAAMVLAGLAGVLGILADALPSVSDGVGSVVLLTVLGFAVALVGGTSVFGRRGGVLGTVLAAVLLALTLSWLDAVAPDWALEYVLSGAVLLGLAATRLVERYGRPVLRPTADEESWVARPPAAAPGASWGWSSEEVWGNPPR